MCDTHAPHKDVKVRSLAAPWISNSIRLKMNRRYKLFKRAVDTKDNGIWNDYKRLRNEITSEIRRAKASYFHEKLAEFKTSAAYWNLIRKATNPKVEKSIGSLRRDDKSLAVDDKEKANLNTFFATIGKTLTLNCPSLYTC